MTDRYWQYVLRFAFFSSTTHPLRCDPENKLEQRGNVRNLPLPKWNLDCFFSWQLRPEMRRGLFPANRPTYPTFPEISQNFNSLRSGNTCKKMTSCHYTANGSGDKTEQTQDSRAHADLSSTSPPLWLSSRQRGGSILQSTWPWRRRSAQTAGCTDRFQNKIKQANRITLPSVEMECFNIVLQNVIEN